jgi:hypothetical protein
MYCVLTLYRLFKLLFMGFNPYNSIFVSKTKKNSGQFLDNGGPDNNVPENKSNMFKYITKLSVVLIFIHLIT